MNILYVCNDMGIGGSQKAILTEIEQLTKLGHQVIVASRDGVLISELNKYNVKHYVVKFPNIGGNEKRDENGFTLRESIRNLYSISKTNVFRNINTLRKISKMHEIDVVKSHQPGPTLIAYLSFKKLNIPILIRVQHILRNEFPPPMYKKIIDYSSGISVITEEVKRYLLKTYNVNEKLLTIIPNQIILDKNNFEVDDTSNHIYKVLTVTRLAEDKYNSVIALLRAIHLLKKNYEIKLTIVGDGPKMKDIHDEIVKLGLIKNVDLVGSQKNVGPYYVNSDVIVGVGRVAMEALYFGKILLCCSHFAYGGIFNEENSELNCNYNFSGRNYQGSELDHYKIAKDLEWVINASDERIIAMKNFNQSFFKLKYDHNVITQNLESKLKSIVRKEG